MPVSRNFFFLIRGPVFKQKNFNGPVNKKILQISGSKYYIILQISDQSDSKSES